MATRTLKGIRAFGLVVFAAALITGAFTGIGWKVSLGVAGPILDIVGALLTLGVVWAQATFFREARALERRNKTFCQWWIRDFPFAAASYLAPPAASLDIRDEFRRAFWGVVFLVFGFLFQAISQGLDL